MLGIIFLSKSKHVFKYLGDKKSSLDNLYKSKNRVSLNKNILWFTQSPYRNQIRKIKSSYNE